jgi:DUF4097 and DUF4098 domain-containing protein YvlB
MNLKIPEMMKIKVWKCNICLAALMITVGWSASGQTFEKSRSVREGFRITPNVEVQVINKYGDIHLVPWDKDSVIFEIQFSVTSNKQTKVDKIFEYVDFDFKSTAYYVIAQTVFQGQNTFWTEMTDMAGTIFSGGTNTRIDYTVYYPEENDLRIENKFGNIYTTEHKGKVDITLSNGDIKAYAFRGPTKLKIDFSNVSVDEIVNANLTLGYVEMNLEKAGELNVVSRSSKLYFTDCEKLHLDSKRDRIYLKNASEISGEMYFSYLDLQEAGAKINLKTNYGDIKVNDVSEGFLRMDFTSQYSDITLYLDEDHLFEMDITRDEKSQVISSLQMISRNEAPLEGAEKMFRGTATAGKQGKPRIPVTINIKSGKLYLMGK